MNTPKTYNEKKAKEIAEDESLYGDSENNSKIEECYIAALAMAELKDKELASLKEHILFLIDTIPLTQENSQIISTLKYLLNK